MKSTSKRQIKKPERNAGLQHPGSKAKRIIGKPWVKGQSGNPSGKRSGSVSPTAALRREMSRADAERIARKLVTAARAGDLGAAKIIFDRLDHPLAGPLALSVSQSIFQKTETTPVERVQIFIVDNGRDIKTIAGSKPSPAAEPVIEIEPEKEPASSFEPVEKDSDDEPVTVSRVMSAADFLQS